jgi:membrane-bound serine protease (ClpP class)
MILVGFALAALLVVIALYRHKNSAAGEVKLIDAIGQVTSDLNPEGSVMVHGELWRARSATGVSITAPVRVRVVEARDHLLIVIAEE